MIEHLEIQNFGHLSSTNELVIWVGKIMCRVNKSRQ